MDTPEHRARHEGYWPPEIQRALKQRRCSAADRAIALSIWLPILAVTALAVALTFCTKARAQEPKPDPCRGYIAQNCCCSNGCCVDVPSTRVRPMDRDHWQVVATGQVLPRTGWSPEGVYTLCACDSIGGKWVVHERAHARCIFVPRPNS